MGNFFHSVFQSIWTFLSTRQALGIFIIVMLVLVAALVCNVLIALYIVRNESDLEGPAEDGKKKRGKSKNGPRFNMLNRIDQRKAGALSLNNSH